MRVLAEQACPVCDQPIELRTGPRRWVHIFGLCTSPTYEAILDPNGPDGIDSTCVGVHDQIRADSIRDLERNRVRSAPGRTVNSYVQTMRDNDSALPKPPRTP
jgi:hypothetical protein